MTVTTIEPALTKKLLLLRHSKQRVSGDAALLSSELLRLFVLEARNRAAVEAECEVEGDIDGNDMDDDSTDDKLNSLSRTQGVAVRAHHITKIAAELLMDFS